MSPPWSKRNITLESKTRCPRGIECHRLVNNRRSQLRAEGGPHCFSDMRAGGLPLALPVGLQRLRLPLASLSPFGVFISLGSQAAPKSGICGPEASLQGCAVWFGFLKV